MSSEKLQFQIRREKSARIQGCLGGATMETTSKKKKAFLKTKNCSGRERGYGGFLAGLCANKKAKMLIFKERPIKGQVEYLMCR